MTDRTQPEALRLANEFRLCNEYDSIPSMNDIAKAEAELRRMHARIAELEAPPAPSAAADLIAALEEARSAINSMKVEAETAGQGDEQMMLEACETISNEGLQADMAIRAALASAPRPVPSAAGPCEAPEGWRNKFAEAVYADLEAADNQDVPLEEYPARILKALDSIVGPRHPTVIHWRNDAIQACIAIACKYCRDPESFQYLKQDLQSLIFAAPKAAPVAQWDAEDAARYRFLAAHCRSTPEHWGGRWSIVVEGPAPKSHDSEDDFDAAIDAARAQAKEGDQHG